LDKARKVLGERPVQIFLIALIAVLMLSLAYVKFPTFTSSVRQVNQLSTGIIIPMFTVNYSQSQIEEVIHAKQTNPAVPFIVVVDYSDGPGSSYSSERAGGIKSMQDVGITVLGYVPTGWGERTIPSLEKDMLTFFDWYHVNGIYLDQMVNWEFNSNGTYLGTYYENLTSYAHSLGMTKVLGNSGADVPYYFVGTVDQIGIFENAYTPALSYLAGWHLSYNKSNFWFVSYNISAPNPYYVAAASDYVSYMYLTNGVHPYPYGNLPTYFNTLVSDLSSMVPITISSQLLNGSLIDSGFLVTVTQPGGYSDTMYTPANFNVVRGSTITISAQNHAGFVFDRWSNGSTNSTIVLNPEQAMNLVAYSKTSERTTSLVVIHTTATTGVPVTGLWTTASASNGSLEASGFTPFAFEANNNMSYTITVSGYRNISFAYWGNTTKPDQKSINVTPIQNVYLQAFVKDNSTNASFNPGNYPLNSLSTGNNIFILSSVFGTALPLPHMIGHSRYCDNCTRDDLRFLGSPIIFEKIRKREKFPLFFPRESTILKEPTGLRPLVRLAPSYSSSSNPAYSKSFHSYSAFVHPWMSPFSWFLRFLGCLSC
jgi:hypothetical protein